MASTKEEFIITVKGKLYKNNKEDWEVLYNKFISGSSIVKLSKEYTISETTIKKYFAKFGFKTRSRSEARSNYVEVEVNYSLFNEVYNLFCLGVTIEQLSNTYGKSRDTIRKYLSYIDINYKDKAEKINKKVDKLDSLNWDDLYNKYMNNVSMEELATVNSVCKESIIRGFKKRGYNIDKGFKIIKTSKGDFRDDLEYPWLTLYEEYRNNRSLLDISREYKIGTETIKKQFSRFNLTLKSSEEIYNGLAIRKLGLVNFREDFDLTCEDHWKELYNEYLNSSLNELSKKYSTSADTIKKYFKKYGLCLKSNGESIKKAFENKPIILNGIELSLNNKEGWIGIHKEYMEASLSLEDIKNKYVSKRTLEKYFKKLGLPILTKEEYRKRAYERTKGEHGERIKNYLLEEGLLILDDYKGVHDRGNYINYNIRHIICGNEFKRTLHENKSILCPYCNNSSRELFLVDYIKSFGIEVDQGNRKIIYPSELDIYITDLNIAFEYNGSYWHSTFQNRIDKNYHKNKTEKCLKNKVKLYHIWDYNNKEIVKSLIKAKLNLTNNKYYARKLSIEKVDIKERKEFFNKNHLHGDANCSFAFGLYNKGQLVQCISFRKHKEGLEIARLATKLDAIVIGGFSKLLKHSIKYIKESYKEINKIITYCDRDWTPDYKDSVYYKNGFKFLYNTGNILRYYNSTKGIVESREKYQKHKLSKLFGSIIEGVTVDNILNSNGIYSIYNSGNWKFELEVI
jgi:hypothetical protein